MLTGAILAGGESRRFGRNKALEVFQGKPLIDHNVDLLSTFCDPVLVIANDLRPYYHVRASLIQDVSVHQGPLGGIYTALLFSPHNWVFVKAADMPFLNIELADFMLSMKEASEVVVARYRDWYEPLLALYHRRCVPAVVKTLEKGKKQVAAFYSQVRVKTLNEEEWRVFDPEGRSFLNINTSEEWERLRWI